MFRPGVAGVALGLTLMVCCPPAGLAQTTAKPQSITRAKSDVPNVQRGVLIARTYCARCHSIDKVSQSPLGVAPPFRDLHKNYPVEQLEEPLAEGLVTGHPSMPEFRFDPGQIDDFIAFLKSLE
jgi:mono/diheme cytochrome c family protein